MTPSSSRSGNQILNLERPGSIPAGVANTKEKVVKTVIAADDFTKFEERFRLCFVMPIIAERFGSKLANEIERAVKECIDKPASFPDTRYPEF